MDGLLRFGGKKSKKKLYYTLGICFGSFSHGCLGKKPICWSAFPTSLRWVGLNLTKAELICTSPLKEVCWEAGCIITGGLCCTAQAAERQQFQQPGQRRDPRQEGEEEEGCSCAAAAPGWRDEAWVAFPGAHRMSVTERRPEWRLNAVS